MKKNYLNQFIMEFAMSIHDEILKKEGRLTIIALAGHVHKRVFQSVSYLKMQFRTWFYSILCIAMVTSREEFLRHWIVLGEYIYYVAEEYSDELIEEHCRKKKGCVVSPKRENDEQGSR